MKKNQLVAEAFGTFILIFAGCGAMVVNDIYPGTLGHVGVSLVWGFVVLAMVYSIGNVSGAHINPAVTLGFFFTGRFDKRLLLPYIGAQFLGAMTAALVLRLLFPLHETLGASLPSVSPLRAFAVETLLSFLLMFVILNVSTGHKEKGIMAGVAVGATVGIDALIGGPLTGASMNPFRSLGPALVSGQLQHLWIYLTAPVLGMFLAKPTCRWVQGDQCCAIDPDDP